MSKAEVNAFHDNQMENVFRYSVILFLYFVLVLINVRAIFRITRIYKYFLYVFDV